MGVFTIGIFRYMVFFTRTSLIVLRTYNYLFSNLTLTVYGRTFGDFGERKVPKFGNFRVNLSMVNCDERQFVNYYIFAE